MNDHVEKIGSALVVGGGIGGMESALDLADSGIKVYLVDREPCIGGIMAQLDKTFPTNDCAMCTMSPRLVELGRHKDISVITLSDIDRIEGEPGNFKVVVKKKPRFVDEDKCTGCGSCVSNCPVHHKIYTDFDVTEIKLGSDDFEKITHILNRYESKKEHIISIFQDISAQYRYLPEFVLKYLSQKLNLPISQIYSVATFYSSFSLVPMGKYKISVCLGTACHVRGGFRIMESFERELGIKGGETTKDLKFTLEAVRCIGCCGLAPVFTINDELFGKATLPKIPKILKKFDQNKEDVDE